MKEVSFVSPHFDEIGAVLRRAEEFPALKLRVAAELRMETRLALINRITGELFRMPVEELVEMVLEPMSPDEVRSLAASYGIHNQEISQ